MIRKNSLPTVVIRIYCVFKLCFKVIKYFLPSEAPLSDDTSTKDCDVCQTAAFLYTLGFIWSFVILQSLCHLWFLEFLKEWMYYDEICTIVIRYDTYIVSVNKLLTVIALTSNWFPGNVQLQICLGNISKFQRKQYVFEIYRNDVFDPCKSLVVNCRKDIGCAKETKCSKTIKMNNWI